MLLLGKIKYLIQMLINLKDLYRENSLLLLYLFENSYFYIINFI